MTQFNDLDSAHDYLIEELGVPEEFKENLAHPHSYGDAAYGTVEVEIYDKYIVVSCLKYDSDAQPFFEEYKGSDELLQFGSASERDTTLKAFQKTTKLFYLVDIYEHGNSHYSVAQTGGYPDQRWDVKHGGALYVPSSYTQKEFRKMKKEAGFEAAYNHFMTQANSTLNAYSDWANGEVYGYSVAVYDTEGKVLNDDESWGYVGQDNADKERTNIVNNYLESYKINDLMSHVVIQKEDASYADLPFKLPRKNLISMDMAQVYDTTIVAATYDNKHVVYTMTQDKLDKNQYGAHQEKYNVSVQDFLDTCMKSNIRQAIQAHIKKTDNPSLTNDTKPGI